MLIIYYIYCTCFNYNIKTLQVDSSSTLEKNGIFKAGVEGLYIDNCSCVAVVKICSFIQIFCRIERYFVAINVKPEVRHNIYENFILWQMLTVCPINFDPFYRVSYYIK